MDLDSYQKFAISTRLRPFSSLYLAVGLSGEVGEVCNEVKKEVRDGKEVRQSISDELGDVLWYVSCLADSYDLKLSEIASKSVDKLTKRRSKSD